MTDSTKDETHALTPIERNPLEGSVADGVAALAQLPQAEFDQRLEAIKIGQQRVQQIKRELMTEGVHYGKVPGTDKPTLFKAGAEVLCQLYGLRATFEPDISYGDGETAPAVRVVTRCELHLREIGGPIVAVGFGAASTWERKHRYRNEGRACPSCGNVGAVIKGKQQYGGGWLCWGTKGGCGAKFKDGDQAIEGQQVGMADNPDQHDLENTVIKMSGKRSYVDATLRATASSDLFTQDLADDVDPDSDQASQDRPRTQHEPMSQPRAEGEAAGDKQTGTGGVEITDLREASSLFGNGGPISTSQIGRLRNLAAKNGWDTGQIDDELARKLSIKIEDIPALGDGYEAVVVWFQRNEPGQ